MNAYKKALVVTALAGFVASPVIAAEKQSKDAASSKAKISDLKTEKKEDIDKEITNARLRAQSGSKKKYSLSLNMDYTGGSIKQPFGELRPNLDGDPATETGTSVGAGVSGRYRLGEKDSVTIGTRFAIQTPFHGKLSDDNKTNISDPSIGYSHVEKLGMFQTYLSGSMSFGTSNSSRNAGRRFTNSLSVTTLTTVGEAKALTVGGSISVGKMTYDENKDGQYKEWIGLYPFAEYSLSDSLSLRTVFGYFNYYTIGGEKSKEWFNLVKVNNYQSVGVGISVSRDLYLYPNIQFIPEAAEIGKTNVALSATINL